MLHLALINVSVLWKFDWLNDGTIAGTSLNFKSTYFGELESCLVAHYISLSYPICNGDVPLVQGLFIFILIWTVHCFLKLYLD